MSKLTFRPVGEMFHRSPNPPGLGLYEGSHYIVYEGKEKIGVIWQDFSKPSEDRFEILYAMNEPPKDHWARNLRHGRRRAWCLDGMLAARLGWGNSYIPLIRFPLRELQALLRHCYEMSYKQRENMCVWHPKDAIALAQHCRRQELNKKGQNNG